MDGTWEEMLRVKAAYPDKNIRVIRQTGKGKGNAVREGFEQATGDMLFILDADLTTPPEDMPKFYDALRKNRGNSSTDAGWSIPWRSKRCVFST